MKIDKEKEMDKKVNNNYFITYILLHFILNFYLILHIIWHSVCAFWFPNYHHHHHLLFLFSFRINLMHNNFSRLNLISRTHPKPWKRLWLRPRASEGARPPTTMPPKEASSSAWAQSVRRMSGGGLNRKWKWITLLCHCYWLKILLPTFFLTSSAFGLGTMIYTGLELGAFFEIPFSSSCHEILRGVNPLLQMIFTFMQMYFIFMNARVSA